MDIKSKVSLIVKFNRMQESLLTDELFSRFDQKDWAISSVVMDDQTYVKVMINSEKIMKDHDIELCDVDTWALLLYPRISFCFVGIPSSDLEGYTLKLLVFNEINHGYSLAADALILVDACKTKEIYNRSLFPSFFNKEFEML